MDAFEILRSRGFVKQSTAGVRGLLSGGPVRFYVGFDPTADSLHVGHLLPVMAMTWLQRAGHVPIALVGGGTGLVGDPSGKDKARALLDEDAVEANKAALRDQLGLFLDLEPGSGLLLDNAEWLQPLELLPFLRKVGRHFSVGSMLAKASVRQRLERGLSFLEFSYQVLQAFDFLELYRREGCLLQLGGDDQWGNITAGIDLARRADGVELHGLTVPLVTSSTGQKMGKTASGAVWLDPRRVSPYDYFQYWVNVPDADVGRFLRLFTFLPLEHVEELEALTGADARQAKQVLALEATAIVHGHTEAQRALEGAKAAFHGGAAVGAMPTCQARLPVSLVELLADSGLCSSRSDARRQIRQGAIRIGSRRVDDVDLLLDDSWLDGPEGTILSRGRRRRVLVVPAGD